MQWNSCIFNCELSAKIHLDTIVWNWQPWEKSTIAWCLCSSACRHKIIKCTVFQNRNGTSRVRSGEIVPQTWFKKPQRHMIKSLIIILLSYLVPKYLPLLPQCPLKRLQLLLCFGKSSQCYGTSQISVLKRTRLKVHREAIPYEKS